MHSSAAVIQREEASVIHLAFWRLWRGGKPLPYSEKNHYSLVVQTPYRLFHPGEYGVCNLNEIERKFLHSDLFDKFSGVRQLII